MTKRQEPNPHAMLVNHALLKNRVVSASGLLFSAFSRRIFHPRPQDEVFRCTFNKFRQFWRSIRQESPFLPLKSLMYKLKSVGKRWF